jgi:hypothetical protein
MATLNERLYARALVKLREDPRSLDDGDVLSLYLGDPAVGKMAKDARDRLRRGDAFKQKVADQLDAAARAQSERIDRIKTNALHRSLGLDRVDTE